MTELSRLQEFRLGDACEISVGRDLVEDRFSVTKTGTHIYPVFSNSVENYGLYGFYDFPEYDRKAVTVVGRGAGLGTAFIRNGGFGAIGRLLVLFPNENVDPDYLAEYINEKIEFHVESSGIPQLTGQQCAGYKILLPSIPEQRLIASALTSWNTAIQKTEQLIAAKERHYSHELSRLFSEGGTTPRKCRLGDISYVPQKLPQAPKADDVYVLVRLYCKGIEKNERQKNAPTKNGRPMLRRSAGELLVGRQNIHNGGFGIVPQGLDGALASNAITSLSFHPNKACAEYVFFFLSRPSYYQKLERVMGGTGQKEISESQLLAISIPLPDIRTQTAISRYLNALRDEINLLGQSVTALKTQKRGLMQKLFTGQWRLPVQEEAN